jgi:radical SAM protein with 4Fe4S-binding SPASM domain
MSWMNKSEALAKLPELLLQGKLSYDFDGIPLLAERLSFKKRINLIKTGINEIFHSTSLRGLPPVIHIEPTNICNLKCPLCPTGSQSLKRTKGFMTLETCKRIIDELGETLMAAYFFSFGEPFMNKNLPEMIKLCSDRDILTITSTNGHFFQTMDDALRIVDSGLKMMIIALDGSTQSIYQSYRIGGDIEKVERFASLMEEAKVRRNSDFPYTAARCVVTSANKDDLPNIERLAVNLGVNMFATKTLGCLVGTDKFGTFEPSEKKWKRFEYARYSGKSGRSLQCIFPFRQPYVFWDGTVVGCEYDHDHEAAFGKIGEQRFKDLWNGPSALALRRSIRKNLNRAAFCRRCPFEGNMRRGTELFCKELRPLKLMRQDLGKTTAETLGK